VEDLSHKENREDEIAPAVFHCPFIYYQPVFQKEDVVKCRACRNRLVLSPRRRKALCESSAHLNCRYFQNPKLPPKRRFQSDGVNDPMLKG